MKWISVKDQLPKVDEWVLVYRGKVHESWGPYEIAYLPYSPIQKIQFWNVNCCDNIVDPEVTHWMPLPLEPE